MLRTFPVAVLLLAPLVAAADDKPVAVKVSGLTADAPAGWKSEKPANLLRSYQFKLATHDKDHADAELVVSPKASPDVTKNFDSWKAQYTPADGVKPEDAVKTREFEAGGAKVHVLDVTGIADEGLATLVTWTGEGTKASYRGQAITRGARSAAGSLPPLALDGDISVDVTDARTLTRYWQSGARLALGGAPISVRARVKRVITCA